MSDWTIGLSTGCFWQMSIFEGLEQIRNSGFDRIEICSWRVHLDYHNPDLVRRAARRIDGLGLEAYSFHAPYGDWIDITALDPQARHHAMEELLLAAEAAALLNVRYFVIHPGPEKAGLPEHERFARLQNAVTVLNQVSIRCRRLGIGLVLENMLPHLFTGQTIDLLWILGALDNAEAGVCLDTGHAHLGRDLLRAAQRLSGYVRMVHASDNHGSHDDHLPPGDGQIDFVSFLAQLNALNFNHTVIVEIGPLGDLRETLEGASRGRRYLQDLARRSRLPVS
jgi:sugar phosphate isomerase/epimerase